MRYVFGTITPNQANNNADSFGKYLLSADTSIIRPVELLLRYCTEITLCWCLFIITSKLQINAIFRFEATKAANKEILTTFHCMRDAVKAEFINNIATRMKAHGRAHTSAKSHSNRCIVVTGDQQGRHNLNVPEIAHREATVTGGRMFCCCFLFLTIAVRLIISKSSGPVFAKFSGLVELWPQMMKLVFLSLKRRCHGNRILLALSTELSFGDIRQMMIAYGKRSKAHVRKSLDAGGW